MPEIGPAYSGWSMARKKPRISLSTLKRSACTYASLFLSKDNVKFINLGLKEKDGKLTEQLAIKVYVSEKIDQSRLDSYELIPNEVKALRASGKALKGVIPVDVVEIGKGQFSLLGLQGSDSFHIEGIGNQGTCAIADDQGFIYTNAHVATDHNGNQVPEGSIIGAMFGNTRYIARINKISVLQRVNNQIDLAVLEEIGAAFNTTDAWLISALNRRVILPIAQLKMGIFEYFSGNEHVIAHTPEFCGTHINFTFPNSPFEYGFVNFYMLQVANDTPNQPRHSHSGSMLLQQENGNWHPAGLVFGGAVFRSRTYVCVYAWDDVSRWIQTH